MNYLESQNSVGSSYTSSNLASPSRLAGWLLILLVCIAAIPVSALTRLNTTTTLKPSSHSVSEGTAVVFTATVTDQNGAAVTPGQVQFCDATATYCEDEAVLATAQLTSAGTAVVSLRLGVGNHSVKAVFVGTNTDTGSASSSQNLTVSGPSGPLPSATSLAASGVAGNYTLTATVQGGGSVAPTGTVTFTDASNGNATLATAALNAQTAVLGFSASTYAVGAYANAVAVGDFDGDGNPDLVTADGECCEESTVSVLHGNGDGTFSARREYGVGVMPSAVVVGDFNGDSKPDIAVVNEGCCPSPSSVSVLLGNGDGTFQPQQTYAVGSGASRSFALAIGDFNGDGIQDLVVPNYSDETVSVLLGNGDGTFQPQQTLAIGFAPGNVAVGDFNRDGKADMAIAHQPWDYEVTVLLGNGDGTFQPPQTYATGSQPYELVVGDFNGDGIADLGMVAGTDSAGKVCVMLGNGDGTFQPPQISAAGVWPDGLAIADFNGDGKLDLAVADENYEVLVLLGNGDGTFQSPQTYAIAGLAIAVAKGDFNGDGKPDIAITHNDGVEEDNSTLSAVLTLSSVQATSSRVSVQRPPDTHTVFAAYGGDSAYLASQSNTVELAAGGAAIAQLISPPAGSTNVDPILPVQFTWTSVPNEQAYYLYVGTTLGAKDVVNSGETQRTTWTATMRPLTTYYVRLWTKQNGHWANYYSDTTFTTGTGN